MAGIALSLQLQQLQYEHKSSEPGCKKIRMQSGPKNEVSRFALTLPSTLTKALENNIC